MTGGNSTQKEVTGDAEGEEDTASEECDRLHAVSLAASISQEAVSWRECERRTC
jgi:hypothetical protein